MTKQVHIEMVVGAEGSSLYIDDYRVVGKRPWGGGRTVCEWKVDKDQLIEDLRSAGLLPKKRVRRKPGTTNES